jgi:hypothetical protein
MRWHEFILRVFFISSPYNFRFVTSSEMNSKPNSPILGVLRSTALIWWVCLNQNQVYGDTTGGSAHFKKNAFRVVRRNIILRVKSEFNPKLPSFLQAYFRRIIWPCCGRYVSITDKICEYRPVATPVEWTSCRRDEITMVYGSSVENTRGQNYSKRITSIDLVFDWSRHSCRWHPVAVKYFNWPSARSHPRSPWKSWDMKSGLDMPCGCWRV